MTGACGSRRPWWGCLLVLLALASCRTPPDTTSTEKEAGTQPMFAGSLSREQIESVIRANLDQIVQCHQQELRPCPALASKIVVRFVIGDDGKVIQSEVKKSTLADPKVENCMLLKIRNWKFPKPPGGGIVDVTYPFVFQVP